MEYKRFGEIMTWGWFEYNGIRYQKVDYSIAVNRNTAEEQEFLFNTEVLAY